MIRRKEQSFLIQFCLYRAGILFLKFNFFFFYWKTRRKCKIINCFNLIPLSIVHMKVGGLGTGLSKAQLLSNGTSQHLHIDYKMCHLS